MRKAMTPEQLKSKIEMLAPKTSVEVTDLIPFPIYNARYRQNILSQKIITTLLKVDFQSFCKLFTF